MNKIKIVILKEWAELFKNKMVLGLVIILPLFFAALSLVMVGATLSTTQTGLDLAPEDMGDLPSQFTRSCEGLNGGECMQYFLSSEFLVLFMILPVMIPITIASYSIVGEKTTSTLEPLLATPITTIELLAGKGLAAIIPSILATWGSFGIFAAGCFILLESQALLAKLFSPVWLVTIIVIGPLMSVAAVNLAVMISSRVTDPRVAEQLSGLVVLPVVGFFIAQSFGVILLNQMLMYIIFALMLVLDAILLYFAMQLFQRETILTRWK